MELPETEGIKLILARRLDSTSFQKDSLLECERYVRGVQRNLDRTVANGDKRENSKPISAGGLLEVRQPKTPYRSYSSLHSLFSRKEMTKFSS